MKSIFFAAGAALLMLPAAASATLSQAAGNEEIIVTGEKLRKAKRHALDYVRELGVAMGNTQAARWVVPICPRATGLSAELASMVVKGIRENAAAAGAPVGGANCTPNLVVAFTDDGAGVVRRVTMRDSSPTKRMTPAEARALKTTEAPIRWWYNTGVRSRDGQSEMSIMPPGATFTDVSGNRVEPPINDRSTILPQYTASHISTMGMRGIEFAAIVVDVDLASGSSLASVIDYVSLVGLAEIKIGASPRGSILSLFQPGSVHRELSRRDEAFLKGLYQITLDRKAEQHRRTLVSGMLKADLEADAEQAPQ